ncbi:glycosyltransferase, partial [Streptomyces sp. NPDC059618]|uniref:glycosyltransferase n=1 Tax=Streptomyces sp. NPDC059618 TaxID=3346887 RepID=UPI0036C719BD
MARIVIHMPTLDARGGAERYAAELAAVLRDAGHAVAIGTVGEVDLRAVGVYFDLDLAGIELIPLPRLARLERLRPRRRAWRLRDAVWASRLRRWHPDILVNAVYRSELTLRGVPLVVVCHFPHIRPGFTGRGLCTRLRDLVAGAHASFPPRGSLVIANSSFTAEHARRRWGVDAHIVYPPCPEVAPVAGPRERMVLSVGRFTAPSPHIPNKRFDVLIEAFAQMTDLHAQGYRLRLVGSAGENDGAY